MNLAKLFDKVRKIISKQHLPYNCTSEIHFEPNLEERSKYFDHKTQL